MTDAIPPGARTPPSSWYTDPLFHRLDLAHVLASNWQYCGPISWVAEPGDSLEVEVAGQPVIILRDESDGLRAFFAVCQHRGGPVSLRCGSERFLQCRYHGWTYHLDGRLRGTPQFERDGAFDEASHALKPVRVSVWQDLLFVCLDGSAPELEHFVAGITERTGVMGIGGKSFHVRETWPVDCNWKVYVDNYLEAYHVPTVHPEYARTLDYANYREEVHGWWSVQSSGFAGGQGYYGELGQGTELLYFLVWPNLMLNVAAGRLQVNHVRPVSAGSCEVVFDYFYSDPSVEAAIEEDRRVSARIQAEDANICAAVQRGLRSPAYDSGPYSDRRERALYAYHVLLRECYAQAVRGA